MEYHHTTNHRRWIAALAVSPILMGLCSPTASAEKLAVEKDTLKLGFIKLTDCAPLVIAKEKGFFEDEGLQVEVTAQSNWKVLLDNVITGIQGYAHLDEQGGIQWPAPATQISNLKFPPSAACSRMGDFSPPAAKRESSFPHPPDFRSRRTPNFRSRF